ncbi:BTAD domain-containing putative transcriptional regulator [Nonomuraea sp. B12E4]|uniref:AfsR/SARP family transcriptional regulator n=1 Tax=Nonomuraea sp. B12E4 TaxID=3153564 RepID=UPI00325CB272
MTVTFHVLGPLEVRSGGRPVRISGRKPRLVLATLLLDAGRAVGSDRLAEVLWPHRPPRSARANLRTYVSSLRSDLGPGHLRSDGGGYAIDVADGALDLLAFEELAERGDHARALALWRGAPLSDLPGSPIWDRRLEPLHEVRLRAAEALIERRVEHGDHDGAASELRGLLAEHPYREDLWGRLVLTLHRGGRKAEALRAYATVRGRLVDELGVEPGAELRRAYELVLADDALPAVPRQLPPDLPDFTGRSTAMTALTTLSTPPPTRETPAVPPHTAALGNPAGSPHIADAGSVGSARAEAAFGGPVGGSRVEVHAGSGRRCSVAVISGPAGAGKSALAVHAAHALCAAFPAGQLYLELGAREPAEPLAEALRALGVTAVPPTVGERSALLRSLLAERPMLVLLDDARDADQVRPLLPGSAGAAIITTRRRITELPGALQVEIGELTPEEALALLGSIAGSDRVAREREAALAVVAACGRLPLAVRNAGTRLAARPGWSLSVLRQRLEDDWLGELKDVRATLDGGYAGLPAEAARALAALGLLGDSGQPGWVVDAALGRHGADDITDLLVDTHLLDLLGTDPLGQPRYRVPNLIARHATERGPALHLARDPQKPGPDHEDGHPQERDPMPAEGPAPGDAPARVHTPGGAGVLAEGQPPGGAPVPGGGRAQGGAGLGKADVVRVLAAWTATTEHAMARLPTTVFSLTAAGAPRWPLPGRTLDRLMADPVTWFEAEHEALAGAVGVAAELGLAESAWGLAAAMVPYLDLHCHLDTWRRTHTAALAAARAAGDPYGEAAMLRGLAQVSLYQDRYEESEEGFTRSRQIFRALGDKRAEATSLCGLGAVSQFRGRQATSLGHLRRALALFLAADDRQGEAFARQAIGRVLLKSGDLAQASESLTAAMRLARELGDTHREGCVCLQLGHLHRAMSFHRYALEIFESLGDRHCGAYALQSLAGLQAARGDLGHASSGLERSLQIFRELGDRSGEASSTQLLGEVHRSAGRTGLALDYLRHASALRRSLPV